MNRANKTKIVADDIYKIPISCLKLNDFLKTDDHGIIDIPWDGRCFKNGVHIVVDLQKKKYPCLYFCYSILQPGGEYRDFEYRVDLEVTKCNYGGVRFWYKCPVEILGCDRRVTVLYLVGDLFACRNCFRISYKTRNKRGFDKFRQKDIDLVAEARDPRWKSYRGKPTRRFKRAQRIKEKFDKYIAILKRKTDKAKERRERQEKLFQKEMRIIEEAERRRLDLSGRTADNMPKKDMESK